PTLAASVDIWDNMSAYKGGFVIRSHTTLLFYDNDGNLKFSTDVNASSGLAMGGGRNDGTRVNSDFRSYYVFVAGRAPDVGTGRVYVAAWDSRTGSFIASARVNDGDPAVELNDRVTLAVDAANRVCVTWAYQPDPAVFPKRQVAARLF